MSPRDRRLSGGLAGQPTAAVQMRLDNPLADEVTSRAGDVLLKVYQDVGCRLNGALAATGDVSVTSTAGFASAGALMVDAEIVLYTGLTATTFTGCTRGAGGTTARTHLSATFVLPLRFLGECVTTEETGQEAGDTLVCTFAGLQWRLLHRLVGKRGMEAAEVAALSPGTVDTAGAVSFAGVARGTIASSLIRSANAKRDTGIRIGSISSLYKASAGPWSQTPCAEALTTLGAARVLPLAVPATFTVRDAFTGSTYLTDPAHFLDNPHENWTALVGSDPDDFVISNLGYLSRVAPSDPAGGLHKGRLDVAGATTFTDVIAAVDLSWSGFVSQQTGLLLRATDINNFLAVVINVYPVGAIQFVERIAGAAPKVIAQHPFTGDLAINTDYTLLAQVDASGDFAVWFYFPGTEPTSGLRIFDHSDNLKTGGALASGKVGLVDYEGHSAGTESRIYKRFGANTPTTQLIPQNMNLDWLPWEPVPDSGVDGVVGAGLKLMALNVVPQVGSVKPDVVIEFNCGARTAKSYTSVISRDGLLNTAYPVPGNDVSPSKDQASIDARGLFEDVVPADPGDAALYKALLDAHVEVRKVPRQVVTFEPAPHAPQLGRDYSVGDTIVFRAVHNGKVRVNGQLRVYGFDLSIDDEGKETVIPKLVAE